MKNDEIDKFIQEHWGAMSDATISSHIGISPNAVEKRRRRMGLQFKNKDGSSQGGISIAKLEAENALLKKEVEAASMLSAKISPSPIVERSPLKGEATLIALLSDWHVEEPVRSAEVNGLNEYNLALAEKRANTFFTTLLRLIQIEQQNTRVDNLVLALLGDFITGNIHEELMDISQLAPAVAARRAQELLASGIDYLLANSKLKIKCICHSGNHGRITKEQRKATEHGNSLEWLLYKGLADRYEHNPRVEFIIPESYHSYLEVYRWTVRFHHGHNMKYGGGIGGITIPIRKAIAEWNTLKAADIDCFGHFHQSLDGNSFISNGAMIGFNAYALSIKARFEEPTQILFGIHSKLGKFFTRQIKFI